MTGTWKTLVLEKTGASDAQKLESVQTLWSGYGEIFRVQLQPETLGTIVIKQITPAMHTQHPRGWNTDKSLQRKLKSYDVESRWYRQWSQRCDEKCRVAACVTSATEGNDSWIVLEDLDSAGFPKRHAHLTCDQAKPCLSWLAAFHARFLHAVPDGLWPVGTYWHLATRPDEFNAMQQGPIKDIATDIDQLLNNCEHQTLVHGDAKVANFCFNHDGTQVAAVDFQYVGGGCGMKDVAYFFGSCFDESDCERFIPELLDHYFEQMRIAANDTIDTVALEQEWRSLFAPAWTDFYRFLLGWLGTNSHAKIHSYTEKLAQQTITSIGTTSG